MERSERALNPTFEEPIRASRFYRLSLFFLIAPSSVLLSNPSVLANSMKALTACPKFCPFEHSTGVSFSSFEEPGRFVTIQWR